MTFNAFQKCLYQLGFKAEQLEPSELNIISLDGLQSIIKNGTRFPKEFISISLKQPSIFFVQHTIDDTVVILCKKFADTPLNQRKIPSKKK